ncbi:MAG: Gfo/Idh/MocA family oxidoreductase [Clostridia bacterium]|nr:Gfo/Idh/MocA family oxidoreductase [Clostridia bacterium]
MAFRWVILGAGSIAGKFADAVRRAEDCEVVAVASRSLSRAEAFARAQGIPAAYDDYARMLQEVRPDAAYIATTTNAHAELTRLCIGSGVAVLCEKAMFMSSAEAQEVLSLARARGVFCMEAMWSRLLPAVREMKRQLDADVIGEVKYAEFAIGWQAPTQPGNRFFDPALGGGAAYDLMVYGYELADFFLGQPQEHMEAAVRWSDSGVDETETVTLHWPQCMGTLSASITVNLDERAVLFGTKGVLRMSKPHMAEGFTCTLNDGTITRWQDSATQNGFIYEVDEVMRCVRAGMLESPAVPHDLTIRCAKMFDRIMAVRED